MRDGKNALLIVGSPRKKKSSSAPLGGYLLDGLAKQGYSGETLFVSEVLKSPDELATCAAAALVILAFPLYADCLPAPMIAFLEALSRNRKERSSAATPRLVAIVNSGFPEAAQNLLALRICRQFAREADYRWAGGLAMGGGEAVGGTPLADAGGRGRHARRALDLAAAALAVGKEIPEEAVAAMARPCIPKWMYILFGGMGWKRDARKHGVARHMKARPYEQS